MKYYFLVLFLFFVSLSQAQELEPGIEGGLNLTIANPTDINGAYGDKKPFIGGFIGGSLRYKYSNLCFLKSALYFENRTVLSGAEIITDINGIMLRSIENNRISNNYMNLKFENYFILSNIFSLGVGLNNHFLLWSTTHFPKGLVLDANNTQAPSKYSNNYFKNYWFSIPVTFNVDMNQWSLWLTFDKGVMSRLKSESIFKERENAIQLGFGYRFGKKEN